MAEGNRNVGVIVGSLRRAAYSRRLAHALQPLSPATLKLSIIEIGAMSLYNQDDEPTPPAPWQAFRQEVRSAGALLFITPEYNRSIPSPLKNAIDVGSRPKGASCFDGKPAAVISLSPGALGAFGANHHLRQCLMCLNVPVMPAPEAYIGGAGSLFTDDDRIAVESTRHFLEQFMQRFAVWIARSAQSAS